MDIKNYEFKARVEDVSPFEQKLLKLKPEFKGEDHQIDTYFQVKEGRLKLREGNIEHALIQYSREDTATAKLSSVILYRCLPDQTLKSILSIHLPVWKVVDKIRRIYYIDNVKFHFDKVKKLGQFVEVEAAGKDENFTLEEIKEQCNYYKQYLGIEEAEIMPWSYSDMI